MSGGGGGLLQQSHTFRTSNFSCALLVSKIDLTHYWLKCGKFQDRKMLAKLFSPFCSLVLSKKIEDLLARRSLFLYFFFHFFFACHISVGVPTLYDIMARLKGSDWGRHKCTVGWVRTPAVSHGSFEQCSRLKEEVFVGREVKTVLASLSGVSSM